MVEAVRGTCCRPRVLYIPGLSAGGQRFVGTSRRALCGKSPSLSGRRPSPQRPSPRLV
jgi:hypothetical protein